jgi:hypothetical protein
VTPAVATVVYVVARLCLGFPHQSETWTAGLSAQASGERGRDPRSVEIPSADALPPADARARRVPSTEGELLKLFRQERAVRFGETRSSPPDAPVREFTLDEVGVILVRP